MTNFARKTISFQMLGGLGNILFPYANALSLAKDFNLDLKLFYNHQGILHTHPQDYKDIFFKSKTLLNQDQLSDFSIIQENNFTYGKIVPNKNENVFLTGYFQSYKYFDHNRNIILNQFSPSDELNKNLLKEHYILNYENTVSIHVRRGNYSSLSEYHNLLDFDYYKKAMEFFPDANFIIFSDDIEFCAENFSRFSNKNIHFINNKKDYLDLFCMSLCGNHIIANSTFSWWGAWLNKSENKKVIAPNKWFGPSNSHLSTKDLIPEDWIKI